MTRAQRNNNPGNIKIGAAWEGRTPTPLDPVFVSFISAAYGFRAMARIIKGGWAARNTITAIITHWAPPSDNNNTPAYIDRVCGHMGVKPDSVLSWDGNAVALLRAIAIHENNEAPAAVCLWPDSDIIQGTKLEASNTMTESTPASVAPTTPAPTSYAPSASTNATTVGGALATVIVSLCVQFGLKVDAVTGAAIATLAAALLGYLPKSGRM
jgi:hypothetical protein